VKEDGLLSVREVYYNTSGQIVAMSDFDDHVLNCFDNLEEVVIAIEQMKEATSKEILIYEDIVFVDIEDLE
jgi:hypothetical protein